MSSLVRIIGRNNGVGLMRDAELLMTLIEEMGIPVVYNTPMTHLNKKELPYIKYKFLKYYVKWFASLSQFFPRKKNTDINIFLEHIDQYYAYAGGTNCFIPNPEWCNKKDVKYLSKMDHVLCKTFFTQRVFESMNTKTHYIGFTSEDRFDQNIRKKEGTFFHLAGKSRQKSTDILVDLWIKHPDWPKLTVVQSPEMYKRESSLDNIDNIDYILDYLDDDKLKKLQNENLYHLCPSEAEGFGHYIVEAMSSRAVTLTTDAPPMNELVSEQRGVLATYKSKEPQRLGMNYYVNEADLENQIIRMINMTQEEKKSIGKESRKWFLKNDKDFRKKFKELISSIG